MEKKHYELSSKFTELNSQVKDAVCGWMKELGHIRFNYKKIDFPFMTCDGEFKSVNIVELKHDAEYFDDATAIDEDGTEWSIQEEGTLDGCIELLYYIEQEAYEIVK